MHAAREEDIGMDTINEALIPGQTAAPDEPRSSLLAASMNFTNSIVGAGIIGLPYALLQAGFFSGLILLILLTILVDFTVNLLVIDAKMSGQTVIKN
jgi:sodium-coupled neutral amino acid transporter 11